MLISIKPFRGVEDLKFIYGCYSDIGNYRPNNEDRIFARTIGADEQICIGTVCDGVGGTQAGEIASEMTVEELKLWSEKIAANAEMYELETLTMELKKKIYEINELVCRYSKINHVQTGSTLSGILICGNRYITFNIGDSRVYNLNKKIEQLTSDDVRIADGKTVLSQCIGGSEKIFINITVGEARNNDTFIFCSDGFYKLMKTNEVLQSVNKLSSSKKAELACASLVNKVKKRDEKDNISLGIIKCI